LKLTNIHQKFYKISVCGILTAESIKRLLALILYEQEQHKDKALRNQTPTATMLSHLQYRQGNVEVAAKQEMPC